MGRGGFAQHHLEAVVAGLGGGVLLAAADDFTVGGHVVEAVLTGGEVRHEAVGLAVGFDALDSVLTSGLAGVALAGLDYFAVVGAQAVPMLAAALEELEGGYKANEGGVRGPLNGLRQGTVAALDERAL